MHPDRLLDHLGGADRLQLTGLQESMWVDVIRKMDAVYSDLIHYEVDLEEKNAALEDAQKFITSVLESVSDILIVCDSKGTIQQVNRALIDLTGFDEHELVNHPIGDLIADGNAMLTARLTAAADERPLHDCEVRLRTHSVVMTDVIAVNCSARIDPDGRLAGAVLIGRPVGELRRAYEALNAAHAELKQAQEQLIQQEKMASLGRLVAGVAHELNNPISFVYGNVHALQRYRERLLAYLRAIHDGIDNEAREELRRQLKIDHMLDDLSSLIDGTLEGAARVSDIVKNLRRLSFFNGAEPERFDLATVVRTAVNWAARGCRRPVPITVEIPDGMVVFGQAGQLHQVVVNLVQNALDAVEGVPAPSISVSGSISHESIRMTVRDNGSGIASENMGKIFEPFFTTKPVGQGTGLGLWISYGIVKEHGGTIIAANAENGGAKLTIALPLARG